MPISLRFVPYRAAGWLITASAIALSSPGKALTHPVSTEHIAAIPVEQARLEAVGYGLSRASAGRCARPEMLTGLLVHNIGSYSAEERPIAREMYDLTDGFGILNVVPGSAAARAGLAQGDEIVAVNGTGLASLASRKLGSRLSYDGIEKFAAQLDQALSAGPARLTIRRRGRMQEVVLAGEPGCGGRTAYLLRNRADAWSDGRYVAVTHRMITFARDDQELAFVVAHEMAHNILKHADRVKPANAFLAQFGIGTSKIKSSEIAADTLAIELMAQAGYDVTASERLLRRLSSLIPIDLGLTHPRVSRRVEIVNAAIARLKPSQTLASATG